MSRNISDFIIKQFYNLTHVYFQKPKRIPILKKKNVSCNVQVCIAAPSQHNKLAYLCFCLCYHLYRWMKMNITSKINQSIMFLYAICISTFIMGRLEREKRKLINSMIR